MHKSNIVCVLSTARQVSRGLELLCGFGIENGDVVNAP